MHNQRLRFAAALLCAGSLSVCFGGGAVIGIAVVNGLARVDNSDVRGNASILDGSVVETTKGSSQLSLQGGSRVEFGSYSRGKVYSDHVALEKGMSQLHASNQYPVLANSLKIVSADSDSTVRIAIKDNKRVMVSTVSGEARVMNSRGLLLAKVMPGVTYEFDQAGAAAQARLTGCVEKHGSKYFVRDATTSVVSELSGPDLGQYAKKNVTVTGSIDTAATPTGAATQVVIVSAGGISVNGGMACPGGVAGKATAVGAAGAGAGAAAGAATGAGIAGLSVAATAAVVGGVAVAGTVGGLAASGTFTSNNSQ